MASDDAALARLIFLIIPNTKRHPNNRKRINYLSEVITAFQGRTITPYTRLISANAGSMEEACGYGLPRGTCFVARRLELVAVAGRLRIL